MKKKSETKVDFQPKTFLILYPSLENFTTGIAIIKIYGVVNEAKNKKYTWGYANKMDVTSWMSDDEFEKVVKNARDPYEAPSIPYFEPTPDKPGKLLWLSGKLSS